MDEVAEPSKTNTDSKTSRRVTTGATTDGTTGGDGTTAGDEMTAAVGIRVMTIGDYQSAHDLWLATPGMGLNDRDDSHAGIASYLDRNPTTCFVAETATGIVGVILAGHDGRRGFIYHLAVLESARRRGIGSALVASAMSALEDQGINKVALVVKAANQLGNAFWASLGFTPRPDLTYRNKAITELVRIDT